MPSRKDLANAIRALSMDGVQQANSGHPGAPMGMADIAEVLWRGHLNHNPANPEWADRDRFVVPIYTARGLAALGAQVEPGCRLEANLPPPLVGRLLRNLLVVAIHLAVIVTGGDFQLVDGTLKAAFLSRKQDLQPSAHFANREGQESSLVESETA